MKSIFITGASGGLGQALCERFSKDPCRIGVHVFRDISGGKRLVERLNRSACGAALFTADLCDATAVRQMFYNLKTKWEGIDILINNAAIREDDFLQRSKEAAWDQQIALNLSGVFYCMREAGKIMMCQKKGHIVNISSLSAVTGRIAQSAYTASKRGLIGLSGTAAREWGPTGVQVNTVFPGFLATPMTEPLTEAQKKKILEKNLLGLPSTLEEVSNFIHHLSMMKHVSGQTFNLDSRIG
ncbi:MAG: SDR family NAD(P)-dependent oxidoreductase [Nitrospiria bacterium]